MTLNDGGRLEAATILACMDQRFVSLEVLSRASHHTAKTPQTECIDSSAEKRERRGPARGTILCSAGAASKDDLSFPYCRCVCWFEDEVQLTAVARRALRPALNAIIVYAGFPGDKNDKTALVCTALSFSSRAHLAEGLFFVPRRTTALLLPNTSALLPKDLGA